MVFPGATVRVNDQKIGRSVLVSIGDRVRIGDYITKTSILNIGDRVSVDWLSIRRSGMTVDWTGDSSRVAIGQQIVAFLKDDGSIAMSDNGNHPQVMAWIPAGTNYKHIYSDGYWTFYALTDTGTIVGWGNNWDSMWNRDLPPRYRAGAVVLADDSLIVCGGSAGSYLDDVWISTDKGISWTQQTASGGYGGGNRPRIVVMPDGSLVSLDSSSTMTATVYKSVDNGATWSLINAAAAWGWRDDPGYGVLSDGTIFIAGGNNFGGPWKDVWTSTDYGANWTQITTTAAFDGNVPIVALVASDDSITILQSNKSYRSTDGGLNWSLIGTHSSEYNQEATILADDSIVKIYFGAVYRTTDWGANWTLMVDYPEFGQRSGNVLVSFSDGDIMHIGGYGDNYYGHLNTLWLSTDNGATWSLVPGSGSVANYVQLAPGFTSLVGLKTDGSLVGMGSGYNMPLADQILDAIPAGEFLGVWDYYDYENNVQTYVAIKSDGSVEIWGTKDGEGYEDNPPAPAGTGYGIDWL